MRKKILFSAFLFIVIATVYRFSIFSPELVSFSGPTMGTTYTVKFYTTENVKKPSDLKVGVDAALVRVNKLMSTYDPNSELSVLISYLKINFLTLAKTWLMLLIRHY